VTLDPQFERRVVAEMARLERAAHRRARPRRNNPMPQNNAAPDATPNGHHATLADRLRRGALPIPAPHPLNPALVKDAEQRAENVQNRIADRITAFSGSMAFVYLHVIWFACWIGFRVEKYPFGLLTMIVSLEAIFLSTFVMISQNRADAKRQALADEQWKTVQEEDHQNQELLDLSKQILDLTKEVHASYRSTSGPPTSLSTSSDGAK
jgi:low affinity Fe/Cu permease